MSRLALTLACMPTDRTAPLLDGRVRVEGCELTPVFADMQDIFRRTLNEQAFDVAEMSMSSHIVAAGRGGGAYVGLPVFLSRAFRHAAIYVRPGIARPEDLVGGSIGIEQFQQTVGLWVRGILADHHGVRTRDVAWRTGGLERPGGGERLALDLPAEVRVAPIGAGQTLAQMLADGALDAIVSPRVPSCFADGRAARLFPDHRQAEIDYFRAGGHFPIMHGVVLRRSLAEAHPWLPTALFGAFARAKAMALADLGQTNVLRTSLPWMAEHARETRAILGPRLWSYGLAESRPELEAMLRYALSDGLIRTALAPEDLFEAGTHALQDE